MTRGEAPLDIQFRQDNDLYQASVQTAKNLIVSPRGSLNKRTGFEIKHTFLSNIESPLVTLPFKPSEFDEFLLIISRQKSDSSLKMYVFDSTGNLVATSDIEIDHPDAFWTRRQFTQVNDVLLISHPDYHPVSIVRGATNNDWTVGLTNIVNPPFERFNTTARISTHSDPSESDNPNNQILTGSNITAIWDEDILDDKNNRTATKAGKKFRIDIGPADNPSVIIEQISITDAKEGTFEVISEIPQRQFEDRGILIINKSGTSVTLWEIEPGAAGTQGKRLRSLPNAITNPISMTFHLGRILVLTTDNELWEIDPDGDSDEGILLREIDGLSNAAGIDSYADPTNGEQTLLVLDRKSRQFDIIEIDPDAGDAEGIVRRSLAGISTLTPRGFFSVNDKLYLVTGVNTIFPIDLNSAVRPTRLTGILPGVNTHPAGWTKFGERVYYADTEEDELWEVNLTDLSRSTKARDLPNAVKFPAGMTTQESFSIIDPRVADDYIHLDASLDWAEEAWNDDRGWPRCFALHQGRLVAGGSALLPQTLFGSRVGDIFNFFNTANATDGYVAEISSPRKEFINDLISKADLHILCAGSTYILTQDIEGNRVVNEQNTVGTYPIRPGSFRENIVFIANDRKSLYYTQYDRQLTQYRIDNLSVISPDKIQQPVSLSILDNWLSAFSLVLIVNFDGTIQCLSINPDHSVWGWTSWETEGEFLEGIQVGGFFFTIVKRQDNLYLERLTDKEVFMDHFAPLTNTSGSNYAVPTFAQTSLMTDTAAKPVVSDNVDKGSFLWQTDKFIIEPNLQNAYVGRYVVEADMITLPLPFRMPRTGQIVLGERHTVRRAWLMFNSFGIIKASGVYVDQQGVESIVASVTDDQIVQAGFREFSQDFIKPVSFPLQMMGTALQFRVRSDTPVNFQLMGYTLEATVRQR